MLSWLARRRERAERIEAEAEALVRGHGVGAYPEARRREREALNKTDAQNWSRVALTIARKACKRVGFDTARRMAADAALSSYPETSALAPTAPVPELDPLDELARLTSESPQRGQFRIQFLGAGGDRGPTVLEEVDAHASNVSTAVRGAAHRP